MPDWNGQWHPYAERFPMLAEEEIRQLAESIKDAGQIHPCVMAADGLGLDGRNRVAACRIAGVEPTWEVYKGDPIDLVMAVNLSHRHMTLAQRAMAAAVGLVEQGKRENGRWRRGSVPQAPDTTKSPSTWVDSVMRAGTILDNRPDLADAVLRGEPLDSAYQQAKKVKAQRDQIKTLPTDLAALVDGGVRDLAGALAETRDRVGVEEVDKVRDRDGAPPPSFAQRAADGSITWSEAATLANEWQQERTDAIARNAERIRKVNSGWAAVEAVAEDPNHPYNAEIIAALEPTHRDGLRTIINKIKEN